MKDNTVNRINYFLEENIIELIIYNNDDNSSCWPFDIVD